MKNKEEGRGWNEQNGDLKSVRGKTRGSNGGGCYEEKAGGNS